MEQSRVRLCFCDIDGVVANCDARFAHAEEVKQGANREYWRMVFTPEHLRMDTLIPGALEALDKLEQDGYRVVFLTSRPEHLREATMAWLDQKDAIAVCHPKRAEYRLLVMKPAIFQFTKTVLWKAGTIHLLASMYGATEIIVVDDEEQNRQSVYTDIPYKIKTYKDLSLQEEVVGDDDHPF